ncbi:MAG: GNAT family N-acetyltransferase [Dehalococcoidia bacterium]|nr:GNAT family N-acetyltransferase [Dehalococcoidia bacterium]
MSIEIRACRDRDELQHYSKIVSYVFASNDGMDDQLDVTQPDWTTCGFIDGKMVATMGTFPFTVRLNGAKVAMGGVTAVGTLPQHRRKGILRQIMTTGLHTMKERNQPLAILWASMGAIYQRFGYGSATSTLSYSFDPRFVGFNQPGGYDGEVTLMTPEDAMPVMKPVYVQYATPRNMMIHRAMPLWQASVLRPRKKGEPVYVGVYNDAAGEPRGYVIYQTREEERAEPGPDQVLDVKDFVALDTAAHRALWDYIRRHDLVGKVVMRNALPEDDFTASLLLEPRMLNAHVSDGIWMRVVDAEAALAARPYGGRGMLRIAIEGDDICTWNNGTLVLETDGPSAQVTRKDVPADLTVTPNALATLIAGHRGATYLARTGTLRATDADILRLADTIFRPEHAPFTPDGF